MKNLKKVLALVVVLTMVLGTVAFANFTDVTEEDASYTAVHTLSSLSILNGYEDGSFKPEGDITRAEFCAVVCRALGLEGSANGAKGATAFSDVAADHWASGYINLASNSGIVNGMGDGTFEPESNVTYEQAVKMLVVALGFEPMAVQKGGYPTGYLVVASTYGMTKGIAAPDQAAAASRGIVAQLTYNALDIPVMEQTGFGTNTEYTIMDGNNDYDYKTLLTSLDVAKLEGVVVGTSIIEYDNSTCDTDQVVYNFNEANDDTDWESYLDKNANNSGYADYTFYTDGVDADEYFGVSSVIYVQEKTKNKYYIIAIMPGEDSEVINLDLNDLDDDTTDSTITYYPDASSTKTKDLKLSSDVTVYYNYADVTAEGLTSVVKENGEIKDNVDQEIQVIENSGDSKYDMVIIKEYTYYVVDEVEADRDRFSTTDGTTYKFDFDDVDVSNKLLNKDGEAIKLEDMAEDDVVAVVSEDGDTSEFAWIELVDLGQNVATGSVTELDDDKAYIDGTEYDSITSNLSLGDEGKFYLTKTGKIFDYDLDASVAGNYGYVLDAAPSTTGFDEAWQIKVLTKDAGIVVYDVKDDNFTLNGATVESDATDNAILNAWKNNGFKVSPASRIITYKLNSSNYIKNIYTQDYASASSKEKFTVGGLFEQKEYNLDAQSLDKKSLEDDTVIFNIDTTTLTNAYAAKVNALVDEAEYSGYLVKNYDGEYDCLVVTVGGSKVDTAQNIAIVSSATATKDENDEDATRVRYYTAGEDEEKSILIMEDNDDSDNVWSATGYTYDDLAQGCIMMFAEDGNGVASAYGIIAKANTATTATSAAYTINNTAINAIVADDDDNDFVFGFIYDINAKNGGKVVDVVNNGDTEQVTVKSATNAYTFYNKTSKSVTIKVGDWQYGDVDKVTNATYSSDDKNASTLNGGEVTLVFARMYNGTCKDFVAFNTRKNVANVTPFALSNVVAPVVEKAPVVEEPVVEEEAPVADEDIAVVVD